MRLLVIAATVAALAIGTWTACVGEDSAAAGRGAAGQPCYENQTCNGALKCVSNACVDLAAPEGGASSSSGSSTSSSGGSSSSSSSGSSEDAGSYGNQVCGDVSSSNLPTCAKAGATDGESCKSGAPLCCPGTGCVTTTTTTCPATKEPPFRCFSSDQCGAAARCCIAAMPLPGDGCKDQSPQIAFKAGLASQCRDFVTPSCEAGELQLCTLTAPTTPCVTGTCRAIGLEVAVPDGTLVQKVGACLP